tara:strand:+ start:658 stop:822 length:165 start_codon:yes stop_codon:yes gene_type:complete
MTAAEFLLLALDAENWARKSWLCAVDREDYAEARRRWRIYQDAYAVVQAARVEL